MRVLILTHSYGGNGAARCVLDLMAHGVAHWGWHVTALCLDQPAQLRAIRKTGAVPITAITHLNYDLAIINSVVSLEGFAQVLERLPTLLWIHEGATPLKTSRFALSTWQRWFALAKAVVFQSAWQRDEVWAAALRGVKSKRVHIVPNALSPATSALVAEIKNAQHGRSTVSLAGLGFAAAPAVDAAPVQAEQGVARGIAWCGSVIGRKRPQDFVEAIAALQTIEGLAPSAAHVFGSVEHLQTVAHPEFANGIAALQRRYPFVRFHGEISHVQALREMGRLGAFVSTSAEETQALVLLEAAALGLPLVMSALPPYRGVWVHEQNCLTYEVGDTQGLQAQLMRLLKEPGLAKQLSDDATKTIERFSWPAFTECMQVAIASLR